MSNKCNISKCNNTKCKKARKHFGLTKNFGCGGFIMPDGKMINLCLKPHEKNKSALWADKHEHITVGKAYGKPTSHDEMENFLKKCKAIRFRKQGEDGIVRVESRVKPNSKQLDVIKKAVNEGCSRFYGIRLIGDKFTIDEDYLCETKISEPKSKDVMKWVNSCW